MNLPGLRISLTVSLFIFSSSPAESRQPAASVEDVASINSLKPDQPLNLDPKLRRALLRVLNRLERDDKETVTADRNGRETVHDDQFFRLYSEPVKTEDLGSINSKELEPTVSTLGTSTNDSPLYTTQDFSYIPPSNAPQQNQEVNQQQNVQDYNNYVQPSSAPQQEVNYGGYANNDELPPSSLPQQELTTQNFETLPTASSDSSDQEKPAPTNPPQQTQFSSSSSVENQDIKAENHNYNNYIPPTETQASDQMTQPTPDNKASLSFDAPTPIDIPDVIPGTPMVVNDEADVETDTESKPSSSIAPIVVQSLPKTNIEESSVDTEESVRDESDDSEQTKTTVQSIRQQNDAGNTTSPSISKTTTLADEKNVKHEVEFLPSSLIVAFTLQQDVNGNPRRVIPLEFAHNQPELVEKRQRELEEKERLLQLELRTLQEEKFRVQDVLHQRNPPTTQQVAVVTTQSATSLQDVSLHEYERTRLLQEQQRLRDELRRQQDQEQQRLRELERRRQQELDQQRIRELELQRHEQQRLRDLELRRQQEFLKDQEYSRKSELQRYRGSFGNFNSFTQVNNGDSFGAVKPVDNHLLPPKPQELDFQKSIDYRVPPAHFQVPYQQFHHNNVQTQISQSVELNRVNRHEPQQFIGNPGFHQNQPNSLQNLLAQSGLAGRFLPAESKDDLNIVSKLLSYNNLPGAEFSSPQTPSRNVLPPQF